MGVKFTPCGPQSVDLAGQLENRFQDLPMIPDALNQLEPPPSCSRHRIKSSSWARCLAIPAHHGGREEYGPQFP